MTGNQTQVDPFLAHEALDRTYLAGMMLDAMLVEHAGIAALPVVAEKVKDAADLLREAYAEIAKTAALSRPSNPRNKRHDGDGSA